MTAPLTRPRRLRAAGIATLACACAAALLTTAQPARATTPLAQAGFARSWTDSVAVPAFPTGGGSKLSILGSPYAISANGRFVAAAGGDEQHGGVVVRDRRTGRQRLVDPLAFGLPEPGTVDWVGIDDSGTKLVLWTFAVDDGRPYELTSLLDLTAGTARELDPSQPVALSAAGNSLVTQSSYYDVDGGSSSVGVTAIGPGGFSGGWTDDYATPGSVSLADLASSGRCAVVNRSGEENAEAGTSADGYLEDLETHTHRVITTDRKGTPVGGAGAAVSGDCSTVAFWSSAELVPGVGGDGVRHLFVRRLATGRTSAVLVDGAPVAFPSAGTTRVRLDPTGRQVSVLQPATSTTRRFTVSAVPAGPTVDLSVPGLIDAVMSGDGRTALLFTGELYEGGQLFVRERVWPKAS